MAYSARPFSPDRPRRVNCEPGFEEALQESLPAGGGDTVIVRLSLLEGVENSQRETRILRLGHSIEDLSHPRLEMLVSCFPTAEAFGVGDKLILLGRQDCRQLIRPHVTQVLLQEVVELADTIDPRFRVLVLTAAGTGLRWGELAALDLSHLNLLRRTATVDCTLTEVGGQVSRSAPKTATARRTVSLSEFLVAELEEHLARHPDPDSFVFSSPAGGPLRRNNFRRRFWLPAVRAAGLSPLRFHDMRHTHVALLIKQGEQPNTIAARLGHRSVRTVLDVYGHLYDGMDRSAADSLNGPFREALADSTRTLERVIALGDG